MGFFRWPAFLVISSTRFDHLRGIINKSPTDFAFTIIASTVYNHSICYICSLDCLHIYAYYISFSVFTSFMAFHITGGGDVMMGKPPTRCAWNGGCPISEVARFEVGLAHSSRTISTYVFCTDANAKILVRPSRPKRRLHPQPNMTQKRWIENAGSVHIYVQHGCRSIHRWHYIGLALTRSLATCLSASDNPESLASRKASTSSMT